jgi:glycogen(starch) synthase
VEADARQLPFSNGEFDAAIAIDLIPHLRELEAGVRELARVVRPGGQLVFDTSNASPWWVLAYPSYTGWRPVRLARTLLAGGVPPEWQALVRHHRASETRQAIAAAGLRVERLQRFGPWWTPKWHLWWTRKP